MLEQKLYVLMKRKRRLLFRLLAILFICYFAIPFSLAFLPDMMNLPVYTNGPSFAWVYTFLQIPLTWLLGWLYWHKAKQFDRQVQMVVQEETL